MTFKQVMDEINKYYLFLNSDKSIIKIDSPKDVPITCFSDFYDLLVKIKYDEKHDRFQFIICISYHNYKRVDEDPCLIHPLQLPLPNEIEISPLKYFKISTLEDLNILAHILDCFDKDIDIYVEDEVYAFKFELFPITKILLKFLYDNTTYKLSIDFDKDYDYDEGE